MITDKKEKLEQIVKTHQCPEHGPKLVVAWHDQVEGYVIRCGEGHYPEEVTREMTPIEEHKAGKREAHQAITALLPRADLATGELLPPEQVNALMEYAFKYKLDPYRGHICLMYGKPYITIDGYLYHANRTNELFQLISRPLTHDEHKTYLIEEDDHAWTCEVIVAGGNKSFTGLGVVTREEITAKSTKNPDKLRSPVVAAHPWQLAQKRAEWQTLRRAFPIGETEDNVNEEVNHVSTNNTD